jgi:hypothetical protein
MGNTEWYNDTPHHPQRLKYIRIQRQTARTLPLNHAMLPCRNI